jgi:hypothetical protein
VVGQGGMSKYASTTGRNLSSNSFYGNVTTPARFALAHVRGR